MMVHLQIRHRLFISFLPFSAFAFKSHNYLSTLVIQNRVMSKRHLSAESTQEIEFVTNTWCPFAQKAWIALEASDAKYQMREVQLYGAGAKPDWFWELNPKGTVPVVVVNDGDEKTVLADSEDILEAIMDGRIKGDGNMISSENEIDLIRHWRHTILKQIIPVGKSAVLGGSKEKLKTLLKELDVQVTGPYLTGEKFTVADAAAFPFFWRLNKEYGLGSKDTPNIKAWLDMCLEDESVVTTIPTSGWWWWW